MCHKKETSEVFCRLNRLFVTWIAKCVVKCFDYFVLVSVAGLNLASGVYVLSCYKTLLKFYFHRMK